MRLARSDAAESEARALMASLPELEEGKMFGVLLTAQGTVLRAFSGQWLQQDGWAPPIHTPSHSPVPERLDQLKSELLQLGADEAFARLLQTEHNWRERLDTFAQQRRAAKLRRAQQRLHGGGAELELESQREGTAWRQLRALARQELEPLRASVAEIQLRIQSLKQQRRELSSLYQQELHQELSLCLSAGQPWSLASLFPQGPPTGTGDCAAPKLLFQAARLGLTPVSMAEFWWGPARPGRQPGHFYAACSERCQPLIGPLLSRVQPLTIVYQDHDLLAVVKPPGVLTVPGRQSWNQDSLWQRLANQFPGLLPVHRLDLETSGLCLFALNGPCQRALQRQFAGRTIVKCYEALLSRDPGLDGGILDQAIGPDPARPGCYQLDPNGKSSQTEFKRLEGLRFEFSPRTGRSHQIRVHAGLALDCPILGDGLYGGGSGRLRLHARALELEHQGRRLRLESAVPF